jgi:hypothetical protein
MKSAVARGVAKRFPLILTSGRIVDYEGGGDERGPTHRSLHAMRVATLSTGNRENE